MPATVVTDCAAAAREVMQALARATPTHAAIRKKREEHGVMAIFVIGNGEESGVGIIAQRCPS
jgi:hypothetical protein